MVSFSCDMWLRKINSGKVYSRPNRHFCNLCIDTQAWGCNQNASLYMPFCHDSFHKDQKGQKSLKNKNFFIEIFRLIICHSELFLKRWIFLLFFKLSISCCSKRITLSLFFDPNLTNLSSILRKLYYIYYILYVY